MKRLKKADIIKLRQVDHVISENTILADIDHPFLVSTYDRLTNDYYVGWAERIFSRHKIPLLFNGVYCRWRIIHISKDRRQVEC